MRPARRQALDPRVLLALALVERALHVDELAREARRDLLRERVHETRRVAERLGEAAQENLLGDRGEKLLE